MPPDFIKIRAADVTFSEQMKYLGITIDNRLTFNLHIDNTINKVDRTIRLLYPFIARHIHTTYYDLCDTNSDNDEKIEIQTPIE